MADENLNFGAKPWPWHDNADGTFTPTVYNTGAGGAGGGDGAIVDGVSAAIKATVKDYANANPVAVELVDTNGDPLAVGGGTQYTEDAAAPANPVGTALAMVRDDVLSGQTTTDGDVVAARGTDKGELYVKHVDSVPVTGPLTDAQLRAVPVPVSGTVTASGPLTDAQLRAVAVPVSGTVTASGPLTDTQLRATAVPVSLATLPTATVQATDLDIRNLDVAQDDVRVGGMAAHDATVADNPVTIGGRSNDAVPAEVSADGEAVWAWMLRNGAQMMASAPHLGMIADPYTLTSKTVQVTTTQTGSDVWSPASGKKIVITSYQIQAGGTTAGTVQLWFGLTADTTYTRGTDLAIFDGEFAPSATLKPGVVQTGLWIGPAADSEIHLTTSANITLTVTLWGYEV